MNKSNIYLDNAATTSMDLAVIETMTNAMGGIYGNPSSTHQLGRTAKTAVEKVRKQIANLLKVNSSEIFFTSGGSEADNFILLNAVRNLHVKHIISSPLEHSAVLHTLNYIKKTYSVEVSYVDIDKNGSVNLNHLAKLLENSKDKTLVSLMYVNNEIGNILPVDTVSKLCKDYKALFHSDSVQAIGHYEIDLKAVPIDFLVASAHKFHGPKGVGFAYFKKGHTVEPLFHGGEQERGKRAGTENVYSILGMGKALEIAYSNLEKDASYISEVKSYFVKRLKEEIQGVEFNGLSNESSHRASYSILNVRFPKKKDTLLFSLDLNRISASGGSACQSGSLNGSHVLKTILPDRELNKSSARFSFSKYNKKEEIEHVIGVLKEIF